MKRVLSIVGPTASGKSALAVEMARRVGAPVVSTDSVQLWRGLDIGSGKITQQEMQGVPHYLLDCVEPDVQITAADFARLAEKEIAQLHETHEFVITAGGSGFYLQALFDGLDDMPEVPEGVRQTVRSQYEKEGLAGLLDELKMADPESYAKIDRQNPVRVCRAVEVYRASGKAISSFRKGGEERAKPYQHIWVGIMVERAELNARIDRRIEEMLAHGWVAEVESLLKIYPANSPGLGALGYRDIVAYLHGEMTYTEMVDRIKIHTHQFAKRQMTWFGRQKSIQWIPYGPLAEMCAAVEQILEMEMRR